jgi:hypothetical protein
MAPFAKHLNTHVCPTMMRILLENEKVKFTIDGRLLVDNGTHLQVYNSGFCLENFLMLDISNNNSLLYVSAFLCKNQRPAFEQKKFETKEGCSFEVDLNAMNRNVRFWLTLAGFVSIFFLLLTLLFYITLPDLCNFQGRIIRAYILSILLTTILLIVIYNVRLGSTEDNADHNGDEFFVNISATICQTIGYSLYFAVILMFCWMSVLCFDLFWTFVCTPIQLQQKKNNLRFCVYLAIGFGLPVLMTVSIYLVDQFKVFEIRPEVGIACCFLSPQGARYYFNVPIFILLACNTIIFIITTLSLWKSYNENKMATHHQSSNRVKVKETFISFVVA